MGLFNTMNTGITGLGTNALSLSVIGDNISNLNTVGYKGSKAEFQDLILQQLGGGRGQLGQGAFTGRVSQGFGQGGLENSSNVSDLAIDGKGFFVVADPEGQQFYSRAGQFRMDADGYLSNLTGARLQGYVANDDGVLGTTIGDLQIPSDPIAGTATTSVALTANLDAGADVSTTGVPVAPTEFTEVTEAATFTSSSVVYDSLGGEHDVTMAWFKTGPNTWDFAAYVDAGETGGTEGEPLQIAGGSLVFDPADGSLDDNVSTITPSGVNFTGAAAQDIGFDFGLIAGETGALTQLSTASSVYELDPNGNGSGDLVSYDIASDGNVTGVYSNGDTRALGQVVLATFRSESNLSRVGHNLYQSTRDSGAAAIGAADGGGRGVVHSYALEMSNVDLEGQFVKMIQSQKGYQASARVVSGADELMQELLQIV